ncbi:co-chaperone GroES [Fusobacterium massiliense]|uniref:co-chaperone GroES n=1 Tax=Fusobacterium massiliense TaxID=1852365 RepID=UPI0028E3A9E5|nr:co-chaperone GroES [Fusobacterium massiliense]
MNIRPLGERVVIKAIKKEEKTKSGIILASKNSNSDNQIFYAEVLAIGKGENLADIKVGATVICPKNIGYEIKEDDEKYIIINAEDILAISE